MKISILATLSFFWLLTSCHMEANTKFYADQTGSAEIIIRLDDNLVDQMKPKSDTAKPEYQGTKLEDLPTEWVSFYEMALAKNDSVALLPQDSIAFMKLMQIKYDVRDNKFRGLGLRIDRADEASLAYFAKTFEDFHPAADMDKEKAEMSSQALKVRWDGKKLTIPLEGNSDSTEKKKKKEASNDDGSLEFVKAMFAGASCSITYRYTFENKIKKVKGKHDFFRQVDDHTVEYKVDFMKVMEMTDKGQSLKKKDKQIIVYTK